MAAQVEDWSDFEEVEPAGQLEGGNIDLGKRPIVRNRDGSISTVRSMSVNFDGREVLIPTVSDDGRVLGDDEAIDLYRRTGKHLGAFDTPANATAYAKRLHEDQARMYEADEWSDFEPVDEPLSDGEAKVRARMDRLDGTIFTTKILGRKGAPKFAETRRAPDGTLWQFTGRNPKIAADWTRIEDEASHLSRIAGEYRDKIPLMQRIRDDFGIGFGLGEQGVNAAAAATLAGELDTLNRGGEPFALGDPYPGFDRMTLAERAKAAGVLTDSLAGAAEDITQQNAVMAELPRTPVTAAIGEAETFTDALGRAAQDPTGTIGGFGLQSAVISAPALALGPLGPAVAALGIGASSGGLEGALGFLESLQEALGPAANDPAAVAAALARPATLKAAQAAGLKRGAIIGLTDALTAGIAAKTLTPGKPVLDGVAQMLVQMAGGAGGEAGAQIAESGRITKPGEVFAEGAGEVFGAPAEILSIRSGVRDTAPSATPSPPPAGGLPDVSALIGEPVGPSSTQPLPETLPVTDASSPAVRGEAAELYPESIELAPALPQSQLEAEAEALRQAMREPPPAANVTVDEQDWPVEVMDAPLPAERPADPDVPATNIDVRTLENIPAEAAPAPDVDEFAREVEKRKAERAALQDRFKSQGALYGVSKRNPDSTILLTPNMTDSGAPYRVTRFDKGEPIGHSDYSKLDSGSPIDSALAEFSGYEVKDAPINTLATKPRNESDQERSRREWRENYDRVVSAGSLADVSTKDIERAIGYAAKHRQLEARKGWGGGAANQSVIGAFDHEIGFLKAELASRRGQTSAATTPAEKPTHFVSEIVRGAGGKLRRVPFTSLEAAKQHAASLPEGAAVSIQAAGGKTVMGHAKIAEMSRAAKKQAALTSSTAHEETELPDRQKRAEWVALGRDVAAALPYNASRLKPQPADLLAAAESIGIPPADAATAWRVFSDEGIATPKRRSPRGIVTEAQAEQSRKDAKPAETLPPAEAIAADRKADSRIKRAEKARARYQKESRLDPKTDDVLAAVAKLGGLSRREAEAQGIDPADFKRTGWKIKRVFTKDGMSFDGMAEALDQYGYPVQRDGRYDANEMLALVSRALMGDRVTSQENVPVREEEAYADAALAQQFDGDPFAFTDDELADLLEETTDELTEEDQRSLDAIAGRDEEGGTEETESPAAEAETGRVAGSPGLEGAEESQGLTFADVKPLDKPIPFQKGAYRGELYDSSRQYIGGIYVIDGRAYVGEPDQSGRKRELTKAIPGSFGLKDFEKTGGYDAAGGHVEKWRLREPVPSALETYTAEDLADRERQKTEAEQRRQAEDRKAAADAERDTFTLTGSSRVADEAAARGQQDLLSGAKNGETGTPAPLYASRPVKNADAIIEWAKSQGFASTLPASDLHVTVAYSREPVDGGRVPAAPDSLNVVGGKRSVEPLGDEGAVVLKFESNDMQARWNRYKQAGASWDYESYTPHITITYDAKGMDLSKVEPYSGPIELGVEKQEPLNLDKADDYKAAGEKPTSQPATETIARIPPRTADTMSDAIALSSPSGRMSKRARTAAEKRLRDKLFGDMTDEDFRGGPTPQPTERERLLTQAKQLRELAERGMSKRKYLREAERLEAEAEKLPKEGRLARQSDRARHQWEETEPSSMGTIFHAKDFSLFPSMEMGHGATGYYIVVDGVNVGELIAQVDGDRFTEVNLLVRDKTRGPSYKGIGDKVMRAIAASQGEVRISNMLPDPLEKFWRPLGVILDEANQYGEIDGTLTWDSIRDSGEAPSLGGKSARQADDLGARRKGGSGSTVSEVRAYLEQRVGKQAVRRLIDSGRFRIALSTDENLPAPVKQAAAQGQAVYGYMDEDGVSWLLADYLNDTGAIGSTEDAYAIFLHEVGVHYGMRTILGSRLFNEVIAEVKAAKGALGQAAARARTTAESAFKPGEREANAAEIDEEVLAWIVTDAANHELPLVKRILAKIRAWLVSMGFTKAVSVDALVELARGAARRASGEHMNTGRFASRNRVPRDSFGRTEKQRQRSWNRWWTWDWVNNKPGKEPSAVMKNGKPKVVYHATRNSFDAFDTGKLGSFTGANSARLGFFFSDSSTVAETYPDGRHEAEAYDRLPLANQSVIKAEMALERIDYEQAFTEEEDGGWVGRVRTIDEWGAEYTYDADRYVYDDEADAQEAADAEIAKNREQAEKRLADAWEAHERRRAEASAGANTMPVYLSMSNPYEYDFHGGDYRDQSFSKLIEEAIEDGHDGVIFENVSDAAIGNEVSNVYIVFNPAQIKSATGNRGTFNPKDPDIRFARRPIEEAAAAIDTQTETAQKTLKARARAAVDYIDSKTKPLASLADRTGYLKERYLTLGRIAKSQQEARKVYDLFRKLDDQQGQAVYAYLTDTKGTTDAITDPIMKREATIAKQTIETIGLALVERGVIPQEAFDKYQGRYLPRVYLAYLLGDKAVSAVGAGKKLSQMGYAKHRDETLPQEYRDIILGEIKDPAFLASRAMGLPLRDLAIMSWLTRIAENQNWSLPGQTVEWTMPGFDKPRKVTPFWLKSEASKLRERAEHYAGQHKADALKVAANMDTTADAALRDAGINAGEIPEGYAQIPNSTRYGAIRGLVVKREIYDDIVGVGRILSDDAGMAEKILGYGGIGTKVTQTWKWAKVAANPPAQVRNLVSNWVLLNLSGVPLHRLPGLLTRALREIRTKGKYYEIGVKYGITESTFAAQELMRIEREITDLELRRKGRFNLVQLKDMAAKVMEVTGDAYQGAEMWSKLAKIMDAMEREGKSESDAAMAAQDWLFDYSLVGRNTRYLRNAPIGAPFLCVAEDTDILTKRGWLTLDQVQIGDMAASFNMGTQRLEWKPVLDVYRKDYAGADLLYVEDRHLDMAMTPDHRCVTFRRRRVPGMRAENAMFPSLEIVQAQELNTRDMIPTAAAFNHEPTGDPVPDALVDLVGWYVTEGYMHRKCAQISISQNAGPNEVAIREALNVAGFTWREERRRFANGNAEHVVFQIHAEYGRILRDLAPGKDLRPEFLLRLSTKQIARLVDVMIAGDGHVSPKDGSRRFIQNPGVTLDAFQMALTMIGVSYNVRSHNGNCRAVLLREGKRYCIKRATIERKPYHGRVWCPMVADNQTWVARRNGKPFITHNTFTVKVLPRLLEVAITAPWRFLPYAALFYGAGLLVQSLTGADDDDLDALKKSLPDFIREKGHAFILPVKDEHGRWQFVDLGYFMPWSFWTELATKLGKTGKDLVTTGDAPHLGELMTANGLLGGPIPSLIAALTTGVDPFTKKEIAPDEMLAGEKFEAWMTYLYGMAMPTWLVGIPPFHDHSTYRGAAGHLYEALFDVTDRHGDPRSTTSQALGRFVGVNTYPVEPSVSRQRTILYKNYRIAEVKAMMTRTLKDQSLSEADRRELGQRYIVKIQRMQKDLQEFIKGSKIAPELENYGKDEPVNRLPSRLPVTP